MQQAFDIAARQIGLNENEKSAALSDYLRTGGQNLDPATTAWCAAFVNATLEQTGVESTGALNARSYLDWGQEVTEPQRGDVAVFSRGDPNGWQGHVGFFDGYNDDGTIRVLGGNQSDAVNVASYGADRLLGFRRAAGQAGQPQGGPAQGRSPYPAPPQPQNALSQPQNALTQPQPPQYQNALAVSDFMRPTAAPMALQGYEQFMRS